MREVGVEVIFIGRVGFYQVKLGVGKTLAKDELREATIMLTFSREGLGLGVKQLRL